MLYPLSYEGKCRVFMIFEVARCELPPIVPQMKFTNRVIVLLRLGVKDSQHFLTMNTRRQCF